MWISPFSDPVPGMPEMRLEAVPAETGSGLELVIFLPPECRDHRPFPACSAASLFMTVLWKDNSHTIKLTQVLNLGAVAQAVKNLPCKRKELSLSPAHKRQIMVHVLVISALRRRDRGIPLAFLATRPRLTSEFQLVKSQKTKWAAPENQRL